MNGKISKIIKKKTEAIGGEMRHDYYPNENKRKKQWFLRETERYNRKESDEEIKCEI